MTRRWIFVAVGLAVLANWASYTSCTGSTQFTRVNSTTLNNPFTSIQLLDSVCSLLTRCDSTLTYSKCQNGISQTGGFDAQLGLATGTYATFSAMTAAEQSGALSANMAAASNCVANIGLLNCTDPKVADAYDPAQSNPFAGAPALIPSSTPGACADFYTAALAIAPLFVSKVNFNTKISFTASGGTPPYVFSIQSGAGTIDAGSGVYTSPATPSAVDVRVTDAKGAFRDVSFSVDATAWTFVGKAGTTGINFNASNDGYTAAGGLVSYNSNLYATWTEDNGAGKFIIHAAIYNGSDGAPVWTLIDGGGLNIDLATPHSGDAPVLGVSGGNLYASWVEDDGSGKNKVRVKKYAGGSAWNAIDNGGLNYSANSASKVSLDDAGAGLVCLWQEYRSDGLNANNQIRAKIYNGTSWVSADGGAPLNFAAGKDAINPRMMYLPSLGKLVAAWIESPGTGGYKLRVKSYSNGIWGWEDGGTSAGISYGTYDVDAGVPSLTAIGAKLYVAWLESNGGSYLVRAQVYDGVTWRSIDGAAAGSSAIQAGPANQSSTVSLIAFNNQLYIGWTELNNFYDLYVSMYNGNDLAPAWTRVDGGSAAGLNTQSSSSSSLANFAISNSKLYVLWNEPKSGTQQVNVSVAH